MSRGRWLGPALASCVAASASAAAQTASPSPSSTTAASPASPTSPVPSAPPAATAPPSPAATTASPAATAPPAAAGEPPAESTCTADRPCLFAERQESLSGDHSRASGFVDLQFGDSRVQAEDMDMYVEDKPDGTRTTRIEAKGNVVFLRGEERLAGDRLVMDLSTGRGSFENAMGFVEPGVFVEARRIERVDARNYRIEGGRFTSCAQPTPRWRFSSGSAALKVDDRITAKNVVFKVKQVPLLYFPYFTYPIRQDQRSTGILAPHFGHSATRGWSISNGFFWAMGRSLDQTFYVDRYTAFGWGFGHELRYARPSPSRGTFRTYLFRRQQEGQSGWEHNLNWNAIQMLPGKIRTSIQVNESSTVLFQEQFQDAIEYASQRSRYSTVSLQRGFGPTVIMLLAESRDTLFNDPLTNVDSFDRHRLLPSLQVNRSPQRILHSKLVLGFEGRAENLSLGTQDRVDSYGRYDVHPRLSRPFSLSFLQVTPDVALRYTAYGVSDLDLLDGSFDGRDLSGPPVQRRYAEANIRVVGPSFQRVFLTPGNFYSDKFKHVIEPQVTWTYRSPISVFEQIPVFDLGQDQVRGTDQVAYALEQRFYAKRMGRSGKPEPYDFLSWRVAQTYYVEAGASVFDPGYASSVFGPGGIPAHFSPVQSRLRFRPTSRINSLFDVEYDVNFHQLKYVSLSAGTTYDRLRLQAGWNRTNRVSGRADRQGIAQDTLQGSAGIGLPGHLWLESATTYDLLQSKLLQTRHRLRYDVQCCGFIVEMIDSNFNKKQGREFHFAIELANVGTVGNFFGADQGGGAFRGIR